MKLELDKGSMRAIAESPEDMVTLLALPGIKMEKQVPQYQPQSLSVAVPKSRNKGIWRPKTKKPQTCDICGREGFIGKSGLSVHKRTKHKRSLLDDPMENKARAPYKPISSLPPLS